jgi:hypothetical protein
VPAPNDNFGYSRNLHGAGEVVLEFGIFYLEFASGPLEFELHEF